MKRRLLLAALAAALALPAGAQTITLNGASQFNDDHAFTKALVKFEELVKKYYGKPINFVLHKNSSLGLEKQYFEYMSQGKAVDYAIVSPAHMSTFSKAAPFIDAPFLFRDLDHWNKVLDADLLKPVADEINQKAEVMLIGYAGGGTRNIFANKPVKNMAELKGLKVRVQGAPIWSKTWTKFVNILGAENVDWVAAEAINAAGLTFRELPLFRAAAGPRSSLMDVSYERAVAAGLQLTDPALTVSDTKAWLLSAQTKAV